MSPEDIKRAMLGWEGQAIECGGRMGADEACAYVRAQVDGLVNGMIRMQGAEATAKYLFALADRAAGGIRAETMWPPRPPAAPPLFVVSTGTDLVSWSMPQGAGSFRIGPREGEEPVEG